MARGKFRPNVVTWNEIDPHSGLPNNDPSLNDYLILALKQGNNKLRNFHVIGTRGRLHKAK